MPSFWLMTKPVIMLLVNSIYKWVVGLQVILFIFFIYSVFQVNSTEYILFQLEKIKCSFHCENESIYLTIYLKIILPLVLKKKIFIDPV